jgi:hypothetical protein
MIMRWWRERTLGEQVYVVVGLLLFCWVIALIAAGVPSSAWDFRNNLWGPTHLLLDGRSPYRIDQLFEGGNSVWMPMALGAFLPLGGLTLSQASTLWNLICLVALLMCVAAASQMEKPYPFWLMAALVVYFLFPPTVSHFQYGQFTLIGLLLAFAVADMLERRWKLWAVALALALMATKPQLGLLLGFGVLAWVLRTYRLWGVVRLLVWLSAWVIVLISPLFWLFPGWVEDFLQALERNPNWFHPSIFVLLRELWGDVGLVVWGLLLIAAVVAVVWLWLRVRPTLAVIWTMALTPLVTPYVWSYDFVLVLPLMTYALFNVQHVFVRVLWLIGAVLIWTPMITLKLAGNTSDEIFWWVPWAVWLLIAVCWSADYGVRLVCSPRTPLSLCAQST